MASKTAIANLDDFAAVCVCFHEQLISYLFADLLEARGVPTKILRHLTESPMVSKIITEPHFVSWLELPNLSPPLRSSEQTSCPGPSVRKK
jgi:hypothetical protein